MIAAKGGLTFGGGSSVAAGVQGGLAVVGSVDVRGVALPLLVGLPEQSHVQEEQYGDKCSEVEQVDVAGQESQHESSCWVVTKITDEV